MSKDERYSRVEEQETFRDHFDAINWKDKKRNKARMVRGHKIQKQNKRSQ